jgi:hypothetical protein
MSAHDVLGALALRWETHELIGKPVDVATLLWALKVSQDRSEEHATRRAADLIASGVTLDQVKVDEALDDLCGPQRRLANESCGWGCDCSCHVRLGDGTCEGCLSGLMIERDCAVDDLVYVLAELFCETSERLLKDVAA